MSGGYEVYNNFFPSDIVRELLVFYKGCDSRKIVFNYSDEKILADPLVKAIKFAKNETQNNYNCGIVKSYHVNEKHVSGAYNKHIDPEKYSSIPLFLCTLYGVAKLTVWDSQDTTAEIDCSENKLILLDSSLAHKISPPLGKEQERVLFFLGIDKNFTF